MDTNTVMIAIAVFALPGLILNFVSGLRGPWSVAASVPVTFGIYGLAAWFYGNTPYAFNVTSVAVFYGFFVLAAVLWRVAFWWTGRRKARKATVVEPFHIIGAAPTGEDDPHVQGEAVPVKQENAPPEEKSWWRRYSWRAGTFLDPIWILPGIGAMAGTFMFLRRALELLERVPHGVDNIFQGWDVHWHSSVIRWISDEGIASPTRMGELQNYELQSHMYYPSAWHAGGALLREVTGISPMAATNLTGLIVPALMLPLSVSLIAWRIVNNRGLTAQIAAALAPLIVYGLPVLYWIGIYVGAWPYLAAMAATGIVLALFMSIPHSPVRSFGAAMAFIGMVQLHPSAATVVVVGLLLWWLTDLLWRPARKGQKFLGKVGYRFRDVAILGVTGLVGALTLLPQILLGAEQTEEVKSFTATEDLTRTESWMSAIFMRTRHTSEFDVDPSFWVWAALVGAIIALIWRRNLWAPAFWGLSVWITVNSLQPFGEPWDEYLGFIGALHYNTAHRLVMPGAMLVAAGAAVGFAALGRLILGGTFKKFRIPSIILSVIAALCGMWAIQDYVQPELDKGSQWALSSARDGRLIDDTDLRAFEWLSHQPRVNEGRVFTNPAEGSGWMYSTNDIPVLFPHYLWPSTTLDSATNRLYWFPQRLGAGNFDDPDMANLIDVAAQDLGVKYIYVSPPNFWAFQEPHEMLEHELWNAPGVTPIYRDRQVTIYALNYAFTDSELNQMRKPGNSPEPLPELPTRGELGKARYDGEIDSTYYHRPSHANNGRDSHLEFIDKLKREESEAKARLGNLSGVGPAGSESDMPVDIGSELADNAGQVAP